MPQAVKQAEAVQATRTEERERQVAVAAPPSAAQARATQGRELDAGMSTQRGEQDYAEGKSVITDADTMVDIGTVLQSRGKSELKLDDMATELRERGYDVEVTEVEGKRALRFPNGDVFVDSSGDGQLGSEDVNLQKSLSAVEQKFGIDLSGLKSDLAVLEQRRKLEKLLKNGDGLAGLLGGAGPVDGVPEALRAVLARTDREMVGAGYTGSDSAYDLWRAETLDERLEELGLTPPDLPRPADLAYGASIARATQLFSLAYDVAGRLARA